MVEEDYSFCRILPNAARWLFQAFFSVLGGGALTESHPFVETGSSGERRMALCTSLPSWGRRRALGHSVWVGSTCMGTQPASEPLAEIGG